ncbi:SDR family NAD(P)-dependent oxidoreductase [Aquiflexum sp. LQ15W]|uniref:SDR family NAD(P)-dependent oxidoreductase n=1 Tax=Cognataquiflexum nitidum TaxID=2922272 RepID=UPI001F134C34|nr:SDR family NAD(P)-dependent oxidoreductase [Cognataquiflexum nitidum]MCH6198813.1 SDR family NAD(P)-dependent oxidoreductase [Cognataquiflexum nitidum]
MKLATKEKNRLKLKYGDWAVVTGASSGIGLEISKLLASAGFNLVINARNREKLDQIKSELESKYAIQVNTIATDVASEGSFKTITDLVQDLNVGLLVVSAGFGTTGLFIRGEIEEEKNMLRVNCEALLDITFHFSRLFAKQKRGGIILLSSMVAFQGVPYSANYAATKAYVQSLGEALAVELESYGVDVLAAAPGPVRSGFADRANMKMSMSLGTEEVGVPILKALGRKNTVLPGFLTKFLVYSLMMVPRWAKVRIMQKVMGGMTAHQRQ